MHSFTPTALRGIIFITGEGMIEGTGEHFAFQMSVLAKSMKTRFGLVPGLKTGWAKSGRDIPFFYSLPSQDLASNISEPEIKGSNVGVEVDDWNDAMSIVNSVVDAVE